MRREDVVDGRKPGSGRNLLLNADAESSSFIEFALSISSVAEYNNFTICIL